MHDLIEQYDTGEKRHAALVRIRPPDGFVCLGCIGTPNSYARTLGIFQCSPCLANISSKASAIFHSLSSPLTKWFLARHLAKSAKNHIAGLDLASQLDIARDAAWLIKQEFIEATRQCNSIYRLAGNVLTEGVLLGGERSGKMGDPVTDKIPLVVALATRVGTSGPDGSRASRGRQSGAFRKRPILRLAGGV